MISYYRIILEVAPSFRGHFATLGVWNPFILLTFLCDGYVMGKDFYFVNH